MAAVMPDLPTAVLDLLTAHPEAWPVGILPTADSSAPEVQSASAMLASALEALPAAVRDNLVQAMADPTRNRWARAAFGALGLAATGGLRATQLLAGGLIELTNGEGKRFGLVVLAFPQEANPAGRPEDLARLGSALDTTFGDRQYVLYLRRAVPDGFDPAPIARAVHLWLGAIQRGEWQGQHAIYEDQSVALELTLTGTIREDGASGRLFTVGPVTALERLAALDQQVVEETTRYEAENAELPLIFALGADSRWRMPRGYVQQLLYGTPDDIRCESGGVPIYEAAFRPNGRSLFSDAVARAVCSLWWIEPGADALSFRGKVCDNPWGAHEPPAVAAYRFRVLSTRTSETGPDQVVLAWTNPENQAWTAP
jgi:hypothetical protein